MWSIITLMALNLESKIFAYLVKMI